MYLQHTFVSICVLPYVFSYVCVHMCVYICAFICVHSYVCVHMCAFICVRRLRYLRIWKKIWWVDFKYPFFDHVISMAGLCRDIYFIVNACAKTLRPSYVSRVDGSLHLTNHSPRVRSQRNTCITNTRHKAGWKQVGREAGRERGTGVTRKKNEKPSHKQGR